MLLALPAASNFFLPGGLIRPTTSKGASLSGALLVAVRGFLLLLRALSEPIWALIVLFFLFPGVLPGALGLGLYNLGVLGRLMAESTENLDQRPLLALKAQGANAAQVFFYGVLPTALPRFIAFVLYRWEVCIRATVLVGVVGAGGIGRLLAQQIASFDYPAVTTSLLFLIGLSFLVDLISRAFRNAVR
jgi:phosphonate transport system permease protein